MTVGLCCSGASSQKLPRRLTPPGGSLQAEHLPIFPRQRICLFANIALILSRCAPKVNPLLFQRKSRQKAFYWVPYTLAALLDVCGSCRLCRAHGTSGLRPGTMHTLCYSLVFRPVRLRLLSGVWTFCAWLIFAARYHASSGSPQKTNLRKPLDSQGRRPGAL